MGEERFLSVTAAARAKKLQSERLLEACRRHDWPARAVGDDWYVPESALPKLLAWNNDQEKQNRRQLLLFNYLGRWLLLASVILIAPLFWQAPTWQALQSGAQVATETVERTLKVLTAAPRPAPAAAIFSDVTQELTRLWLTVLNFGQTLAGNLNYGWEKISANWKQFLGRPPPPADNLNESKLDQSTLVELKAEIKAELLRELSADNQLAGPMSRLPGAIPGTGLVTLPASGDPAKDAAALLELKNAFSDQVEVRFEASQQTGVITPIFRTGRGTDYLFVITPISRSTP